MNSLSEICAGQRLNGIVVGEEVEVLVLQIHGLSSATIVYRTGNGQLGERLLAESDLADVNEVAGRRWSFDADGEAFRLASEAQRMRWAHLHDPFVALDTSKIDPYPHQIEAVYDHLLNHTPLRFLLADDPGAGKTIMSGLLIRELMMRGDVARCLIVAPGGLVEQWQDELGDKFNLAFDLMSREAMDTARSGNPFLDRNLLIARLDQLARGDDLREMLKATDWDLVIVDEAHKMSAHQYTSEIKKTKRFELGELLRDRTRHLLLLSATPHNGKNDDFMAFMTLIDPERFAGRLRNTEMPDVSDVMRRRVKENLRTFEGNPLFPKRTAISPKFELSPPEHALYEKVTDYVRYEMNRADEMNRAGKRKGIIVGFALAVLQRRLASSPEAIYKSLSRRHDRLAKQARELGRMAASKQPITVTDLPKGLNLTDLEDFDHEDYDNQQHAELEQVVDAATAAATVDELEAEVNRLADLVENADRVRNSRVDTKWTELRDVLRSEDFRSVDGPRKLIVFTEYTDTLNYVAERIRAELGAPESVLTIHGGINRKERRAIQDRFRVDPLARILVATDAAGEGVNLQIANMVVNYDLPWNPNRIEQRFGRVHRIGQQRPCFLWNLVAHNTREGKVFERLFEKIEQQKKVYGNEVYDVLGDSAINKSLRELLIRAIRDEGDPEHRAYMDQVIDDGIGAQVTTLIEESLVVATPLEEQTTGAVRDRMESARAHKLQPWFVEAFFIEAFRRYGGTIHLREAGRFQIGWVPAALRSGGTQPGEVHERYFRVTFDKQRIQPKGHKPAELISPGSPLLIAVVDKVLAEHAGTLQRGATLIAPEDHSTEPRLLVYIDHSVTDGRQVNGQPLVISRRFHYVEIDRHDRVQSHIEPYLAYAPANDQQLHQIKDRLDFTWVDSSAEDAARNWAIEHLASKHLEECAVLTKQRVHRTREAVRKRLHAEIRYWDMQSAEAKQKETDRRKPKISSARAKDRAERLADRLARRRLELDLQDSLASNPPTIAGAALIVPQGLLDVWAGNSPDPEAEADRAETDRRGVMAVCKAEKAIGRVPTPQTHSNPGFDIESVDPETGMHYFIEVKSHLPQTTEISVSTPQVQKAKTNPERWRLAIASVPEDPSSEPTVRYLIEPFRDHAQQFAQTKVILQVAKLLERAKAPC